MGLSLIFKKFLQKTKEQRKVDLLMTKYNLIFRYIAISFLDVEQNQ